MKNRNKRYFLIYFRLIVSCLFIALLSASPPAKALVNQQINYQAELTDVSGYAVADGNYDVVFKIYDAASAGTLLWTGTYTTANGNPITTVNGVFSVLLGSGTGNAMSLDFELDTYYLGVKVGADAEMTPRKRIGSVPQAFNAKNLMSNGFINIAGVPTGAGVNQGTVYVNPATATSGYTLLGAAVGGVQKFKLTEAGDLSIAGAITGATGVTSSGTITFSGLSTAGIVTNTSGGVLGTTATVPVANGGTNIASYTIGDMIYASGATTLSKLADVATGSVLISGGVGAAPSWGTLGASGITADSLDFTEFKDALTLDASTDISATGTNVLSISNTGTGNSFLVNDEVTDTTPFIINASGNVGIGTTNPLAVFQIGSEAISATHKNAYVSDYDTGAGYAQYEGNWTSAAMWGMGPLTGTADNTIQIGNVSDRIGTWGATQNLKLVVGGNVGIGDTTPASALTVGSGDLFQVNSSGAIASATGITSSGTITFSGLSTAGIVTNTSGGVLGTVASVPVANGGTNATTIGSAGSLAYSTGSAYAFSAVGTAGQALVSGGTGAPTFFAPTLGSVLFATTSGALAQNNAQFFWDNTNNRLGLGDATPDNQLDLLSSAAINNGLIITNTNAGNYNPNIQFELAEGTPLFTFGIDDLDNDMFKIASGSDITGTNQFSIDSSGVTSIANLNLGAQSFESDPGIISWIDMPVTSSATIGTVESYTAQLDGNPMITVYGESDGAGSIQNSAVGIGTTTPTTGSKLTVSQSSTSTTADTQYGIYNTTSDTGIVTTGTDTTYGSYITLARTGATGGTINSYGQYITATADAAGAGTSTLYGQYVTVTGADTNYAAAFMGGNLGIGSATPTSLLSVGSTSQFQVNSSGAIAAAVGITNTGGETTTGGIVNLNASSNFAVNIGTGTSTGAVSIGGNSNTFALNSTTLDISTAGAITGATGITSSGTITFSGLATAGIVTNTSGGVLGTVAILPVANGGSGTSTAFTLGSALFAGASGVYSQDNAKFFWDDTNNRLGIGTATPGRALSIFETSANPQLKISYDATNYSESTVSATGDLTIAASGGDIGFLNENLSVCSGGACQTTTNIISGTVGNLVVENDVEVGGDYTRTCATGYVWVPGSAKQGTLPGFCVMKYEAKGSAGAVVSTPTGSPYVSLDQPTARTQCEALGTGYHLVSEHEWMTVAENIATTPINDLESTASLQLATGHSANTPTNALATTAGADPVVTSCNKRLSLSDASNAYASTCQLRGDGSYGTDDNDKGYYGTGQAYASSYTAGTDNDSQLRTHVLSNGQVIWDVAGNVWEWSDAYVQGLPEKPQPTASAWIQFTAVTDYRTFDYARPKNPAWTSANGIGQYYAGAAAGAQGVIRGGSWIPGADSGVFALHLDFTSASTATDIGFRCAR